MKKEEMGITKYLVNFNDNDYTIYLMANEEQKDFTDFYIQKKGYGLISHVVGININELDCSVETFIDDNLTEWIESCEDDIHSLETI